MRLRGPEVAHEKGWFAAIAGIPLHASWMMRKDDATGNPYGLHEEEEYKAWEAGWHEGQKDLQESITLKG